MDLSRMFDLIVQRAFEPLLNWSLNNPIISAAVVLVLVYWAVRGYRML